MSRTTARAPIENPDPQTEAENAVEAAILRFLYGDDDGAALFEALYGAGLDEPIPERMLELVRGHCPRLVSDSAS